MLEIDFLVSYYLETVGVKSPGLKDAYCKLSDTLVVIPLPPHCVVRGGLVWSSVDQCGPVWSSALQLGSVLAFNC